MFFEVKYLTGLMLPPADQNVQRPNTDVTLLNSRGRRTLTKNNFPVFSKGGVALPMGVIVCAAQCFNFQAYSGKHFFTRIYYLTNFTDYFSESQ